MTIPAFQRVRVTFKKHFIGGKLHGLVYPNNAVTFYNLNDAHDYMGWLEAHDYSGKKIIKGFGDQNYQISDIKLELIGG